MYSSRSKSSSECISDLTLVTQRDRDRSKWAGAMGGTLGKPAGLRGSAGAGLSCLRTFPGLGEVLPPFLETGLSGFREGWHCSPLMHRLAEERRTSARVTGQEGEGRILKQQWREQVCSHSCQVRIPRHFSVCVTTLSVTSLCKQLCCGFFLAPKPPTPVLSPPTTTSGHHSLSFADEEASLERKTRVPRTERKECILQ